MRLSDDPHDIVDRLPMSRFQVYVILIMAALNAIEGFDVLSISFAAPGITRTWGIDRSALGIVLSMELVGMAVGSILLGNVADRIGRRLTVLGSLVAISVGMLATATSQTVLALCLYRALTGIGIGGLMVAINTSVAEASNAARRHLAIMLVGLGYPLGAVLGGAIATMLLHSQGWRSIFIFGGCVTLVFIPAVLLLVPESIGFLARSNRADAEKKINKTLARMGRSPISAVANRYVSSAISLAPLFTKPLRRVLLLLTLAYVAHFTTHYFIIKWAPQIVADRGYAASAAGGVLVWANVGGALGCLLLGLSSAWIQPRLLTIVAMSASFFMVALFGRSQNNLGDLSLGAALAGFCTNAGVVSLYGLIAASFPIEIRATATGLLIGVGRVGSAFSPVLAGLLFTAGCGLATVAAIIATGSLIAALAIVLLGNDPLRRSSPQQDIEAQSQDELQEKVNAR
jgi:benzoate transport